MKIVLALIIILALASATVGSTFASFCDTEMSEGNYLITGYLDLRVAKADALEFCDDQPYGTGLFLEEIDTDEFEIVPCFMAEEDETFAGPYICNLTLWNAGSAHGKFYVHIREVAAIPKSLLTNTSVTIWYDQNDDGSNRDSDGNIDKAEVVTGTLEELACQSVPLETVVEPVVWLLPAEGLRSLKIVIDPPEGAPGNSLTFNIQFGLIGASFTDSKMVENGFCDTEVCLNNYLKVKE